MNARTSDPDTSHAAASKDRTPLRERIAIVMNGGHYEPRPEGWTGHEMAAQLRAPLNSVTPRFAELRRASRIKDSGQRRDGQVVWVVASATVYSEAKVEHQGVTYVPKEQRGCDGCAFDSAETRTVCLAAQCRSLERGDGRSVIFVKAA